LSSLLVSAWQLTYHQPLLPVPPSSNHQWTSFQAHFILRLAYYEQDNRI
jgi:hypothetical protein